MSIRNEIRDLSVGRLTNEMVERLESVEPIPQARPVQHKPGTKYVPLATLGVHPNNPRNHADTFLGVAVPSSLRIPEMVQAILYTGDITEPLTVAGKGCHSKAGTVYKGNRRLEALLEMERQGTLPDILKTRGVPVDQRDNLTEQMELHELFDHGGVVPLLPTEAFRSMLAMQMAGYTPEEIVTRHPGLISAYMRKTLDPLPTDANERKKWYAAIRDTLKYQVLSWGLFPAEFLPVRILLIQEEKEGMYTGKAKPEYKPFKPTSGRAKKLYTAMLKDKAANVWKKDGKSPEFSKLVEQFTTEDSTKPATETATETTETTASPLSAVQQSQLKETVGGAIPIVAAIMDYQATGTKPEGLHDLVKATGFAVALADNIAGDQFSAFWQRTLPVAVYAAIKARSILALNDAIIAADKPAK